MYFAKCVPVLQSSLLPLSSGKKRKVKVASSTKTLILMYQSIRHHISKSCVFLTHCHECWKSHTSLCNMRTLLFIPRSCLSSGLQSARNLLSLLLQSSQSTGHRYNWRDCIVTHASVLQECGTLMTLCQCAQHVVSVWTHISSITPCQWPFCTVLTPVTCGYRHCLSLFLINLWMEPSSTRPGRSLRSSCLVPGYVVMSCIESEWHTCSTALTYVYEGHPTGGHAVIIKYDIHHQHYQVCKCDNFADIMRRINSGSAFYHSG